jgi:hypothetical protein
VNHPNSELTVIGEMAFRVEDCQSQVGRDGQTQISRFAGITVESLVKAPHHEQGIVGPIALRKGLIDLLIQVNAL